MQMSCLMFDFWQIHKKYQVVETSMVPVTIHKKMEAKDEPLWAQLGSTQATSLLTPRVVQQSVTLQQDIKMKKNSQKTWTFDWLKNLQEIEKSELMRININQNSYSKNRKVTAGIEKLITGMEKTHSRNRNFYWDQKRWIWGALKKSTYIHPWAYKFRHDQHLWLLKSFHHCIIAMQALSWSARWGYKHPATTTTLKKAEGHPLMHLMTHWNRTHKRQ